MTNLNYTAIINPLSYGVCGLNFLIALDKIANVSYFPISQCQVTTKKEHAEIVQKSIKNAELFDYNAPSIKLWHQNLLQDSIGKGLRIGFPIFELNRFNDIELNSLKSVDHLYICSKWAQNILKENDIDIPSTVIPLGVDREIFYDSPTTREDCRLTELLFVGKIEVRKGLDLLAEWFGDAFESNDNVRLNIMWTNIFISKEDHESWERLYKETKLGDKIRFIPYQQRPQDLNVIYNSVDCLISLSRAEGWNLPLLEGLSCGKQVIATNYSGHTEFLNQDNAHLIEIEDLETAYDGKWFFGQGEWAVLADSQKEQFIHYVRDIHKKVQAREDITNYSGIETAKQFSWDAAASKIIGHINTIG